MSQQPDTDALQRVYEIAQAFEDEFDAEFIDALDASHTFERHPDFPDYMVRVVVDGQRGETESGEPYGSQYTYPACEFGRDRDLFVFDHVVVTGYEAREERGYDTNAAIEIRFGLDETAVEDA